MATKSRTATPVRQKSAARKPKLQRRPHEPTPVAPTPRRAAKAQPREKSAPAPSVSSAAAPANFTFYVNSTLALVCLPREAPAGFSLETAADLTGVHPAMLRYYCRLGLLGEDRAHQAHEPTFDEEALIEIRRIEHYRRHLAVSRRALPLICELRRAAERQHVEIRFLRVP